MIEKREWRRIDINLSALARPAASLDGCFKVEIVNINPQGFCLTCDREFALKERLELTVELQGTGLARLMTEVAWSGFLQKEKAYLTGVKVIATDQEECEKFIKFYNLKILCAPSS